MENLQILHHRLKHTLKSAKYTNIRFKRLAAVFSVFLMIINSALTATWPTSAQSTSAIFTQKDSFNGFTQTELDATVVGPSSNNIYYLYKLSYPYTAVIRKMKPDNTLNWMTALSYEPTVWSLAVSLNEANVYISSNTGPIQVTRLSAINGAALETITQ